MTRNTGACADTHSVSVATFLSHIKVHLHQRAQPQTEPCNVTNSYVWTVKTSLLSTIWADQQTIQGDPYFVGFLPITKGFATMCRQPSIRIIQMFAMCTNERMPANICFNTLIIQEVLAHFKTSYECTTPYRSVQDVFRKRCTIIRT